MLQNTEIELFPEDIQAVGEVADTNANTTRGNRHPKEYV
jgi:hypothetical protein